MKFSLEVLGKIDQIIKGASNCCAGCAKEDIINGIKELVKQYGVFSSQELLDNRSASEMYQESKRPISDMGQ